MTNWEFKPHWYLGLLALVGIWKLPTVWAYVLDGQGTALTLTNLLWLFWAFELIPVRKSADE